MLLIGIPPSIKAGSPNPKIPACFAYIADLLSMLEHSQLALNVTFFVRHKNFLHPKLGNLQEVSRESVHIYTVVKRIFSPRWHAARPSPKAKCVLPAPYTVDPAGRGRFDQDHARAREG